ncbi:hypothetical protein NQ317_015141 [Molorchus minor]|uniref:Rhodanese domain-containing protein n=1 Tax=Molorchus minor TaxID=1323400 RepID=A0ABQ9K4W4_9CUCU|nr:hypothetical protein NQ317_015141 [Molorchus minor]
MYRALPFSVLSSILRIYPRQKHKNRIIHFASIDCRYSTESKNIVTYKELKEISTENANALIIDVREPEELLDTVADLENVLKTMSHEEFRKKYGMEKPNFDKPIVFSCMKGIRSADAQSISQRLGYRDVKNYLGGWVDWAEQSK